MEADLRGRTALITGATSGIGLATAENLASRGAHVILGVRNVKAGQKVAKKIMSTHKGAKVEVGPALDLKDQDSVKKFATAIAKRPGPINILINNAGIGYHPRGTTEQGVNIIPQVNHLGPYTLTRMLESKLVQSKARIVNVASVTHRFAAIKDVHRFFTEHRNGFYPDTKLANIYTAFELQRRLGKHGVQACCADPGGVLTNIYKSSPKLSQGWYYFMIKNTYAPPSDGAKSVIFAATCDWDKTRPAGNSKSEPEKDLRYYSKGMFTWPFITNDLSQSVYQPGLLGKAKFNAWGLCALLLSWMDWHTRRLFPFVPAFSQPKTTRPCCNVWDKKVAAELWNVSAEYAGVPKNPKV